MSFIGFSFTRKTKSHVKASCRQKGNDAIERVPMSKCRTTYCSEDCFMIMKKKLFF